MHSLIKTKKLIIQYPSYDQQYKSIPLKVEHDFRKITLNLALNYY